MVSAGDYVFAPGGTPHTYRNAGPSPARILDIISPSDGLELLAELGAVAGSSIDDKLLADVQSHHAATWWTRSQVGENRPTSSYREPSQVCSNYSRSSTRITSRSWNVGGPSHNAAIRSANSEVAGSAEFFMASSYDENSTTVM